MIQPLCKVCHLPDVERFNKTSRNIKSIVTSKLWPHRRRRITSLLDTGTSIESRTFQIGWSKPESIRIPRVLHPSTTEYPWNHASYQCEGYQQFLPRWAPTWPSPTNSLVSYRKRVCRVLQLLIEQVLHYLTKHCVTSCTKCEHRRMLKWSEWIRFCRCSWNRDRTCELLSIKSASQSTCTSSCPLEAGSNQNPCSSPASGSCHQSK